MSHLKKRNNKKVEILFTTSLWESFMWFFWASALFLYANKFVKMQVGKIRKWNWTRVALHQLPSSVRLNAMGWNWRSSVMCLRVGTFLHYVALVGTCSPAMSCLQVSGLQLSYSKEMCGTRHAVLIPHQSAAAWAEFISKAPSAWKEGRFVFSSTVLPGGRCFAKLICWKGS